MASSRRAMYLRHNEGSPRQTGICVKEPGKVSKPNRAAEVGWAYFRQAGGYAWEQYWYFSSFVLPGLSMGILDNTPWAPTRWSEKGWQTIPPLQRKQQPRSPEKAHRLLGRQQLWPKKSGKWTGCPFPKIHNVSLKGWMAKQCSGKQSQWESTAHHRQNH